MTKKNRRRASGKASNSDMTTVVSSNRPTGSTTSFPRQDLVFRRQNFNIVQRPPRQLSNQIWWGQFKYDVALSSSSSGISESNFTFSASSFATVPTFLTVFDQYCLYSVLATFNISAGLATGSTIRLWTAIDYDSVQALGSKILIQAFGTCAYHALSVDTSAERLLFPCIAPQVTNASNLPSAAGIGRAWLDSAYPGTPHYALRTLMDVSTTNSTTVEMTITAVFGFRNSI